MMIRFDGSTASIAASSTSDAAHQPGFSERLHESGLEKCFEFWCSRRRDGEIPLKRAIDPVEMPLDILPHLFMYERVDGRFRCRLVGTEVVTMLRQDITGRYLDDFIPAFAIESRRRLFNGVLNTGMPVIYGGHLAEGSDVRVFSKRLLLPLTRDGSAVDIVLGMMVFPQFQAKKAERKPLEDRPHDFEAWASPADLRA